MHTFLRDSFKKSTYRSQRAKGCALSIVKLPTGGLPWNSLGQKFRQLHVLTSEKLYLRMKGIGNGDGNDDDPRNRERGGNNDDPRVTAMQFNSAIALFVLETCTGKLK